MSSATGALIYSRKHIQKMVQMVGKAIGANPHGWLAEIAGSLVWRRLQKNGATA